MDKADAGATKKVPIAKATDAKAAKPAEAPAAKPATDKKPIYKAWWFWVIIGVVVAGIAVGLVFAFLPKGNNGGGQGPSTSGGNGASCESGSKDMISEGTWIVGQDIASGDYKFTPDDYAYIYIYENADAKDYLKSLSIYSGSEFVHLDDGQKVEVYSGTINLVCQDLATFS